MMIDEASLTCDSWYGSLKLWQSKRGFRATTDAILLAACVPDKSRKAIEFGAGSGAVTLAVTERLSRLTVTAIESDPIMSELLRRNIKENNLSNRITSLEANIFDELNCARGDVVFFNPPYNDIRSSLSPDVQRKEAMASAEVSSWIERAHALLEPKGRIILISRSDRLGEILAAFEKLGAGEVVVRAVHGRPEKPAKRVLVTARKGVSGAMTLLPPLILQKDAETLTEEMKAICHAKAPIELIAPRLLAQKPRSSLESQPRPR